MSEISEVRKLTAYIAVSLFDYTGTMLLPWLKSGYSCYALDLQHDGREQDGINRIRDRKSVV